MNFKIGDLVRFVDEPIEGRITSIQANDIVGVTDSTGFEIPVLKNKITSVHGNMRMPEDDIEEKITESRPFVNKGIYIGVAGDQKEGLAKFYLINDTSYDLLTSVSELSEQKTTGLYAGIIAKRAFAQIYTANFSNMGKWPNFLIQIIKHTGEKVAASQPINREFRVKPMSLSDSKERHEMIDEKVWLFELDQEAEDIGIDKLKAQFVSHRPHKR